MDDTPWWVSSEHIISTDKLLQFFDLSKPMPKVEGYKPPPRAPLCSVARAAVKRDEEAAKRGEDDPSLHKKPQVLDPYYTSPFESGQQIPGVVSEEDYFVSPLMGLDTNHDPTPTEIFTRYDFSKNSTPYLPITSHREKIVRTIETNQVTIIQGSTGSGKSTQVPQYILDHYASQGHHCNIICTQPRRIAAMSVAHYVSRCRNWPVGSLVGYQIAMDKVTNEDTRITFVTTGVLLMRLINEKNMNRYTHVILDEVHDRDKDTDFCLLLVLRLLRTNSRNVKVVLMSATMESQKFAKYFAIRTDTQTILPPILNIEGHMYPVIDFFLDSMTEIGTCDPPSVDNPRLTRSSLDLACNILRDFNRLEKRQKDEPQEDKDYPGTVLVFLPGMPEIRQLEDILINECTDLSLNVLPLHSTISSDEQRKVFIPPDKDKRKVILATNIAESSVTVPDIRYVIDFCLTKELMVDVQTNYQYLKLNWASKASLTQRKGRAGRVQNGRCYRLITEEFYIKFLAEQSVPEILRCPLESLVLHTKRLDIGDPKSVLRWAITPPNLKGIEQAVLTLKEVGGLTLKMNEAVNPFDGHLTFLGLVLSSLPVDVRIGKLLILGHVFGCLEECLIIGAALSLKSIFAQPYHDEKLNSYRAKMSWSQDTFSDCLAILNAYKQWFTMKTEGHFMDKKLEGVWCRRNFITMVVLRELSNLVDELKNRLKDFNIRPTKTLVSSKYQEMSPKDVLILKLAIAGAFYPNYFYWGEIDEDMSRKELSGHDPTTTVMVSGLPPNADKYCMELAGLFKDCGKGKALHFEQSRLYVEFERPRGASIGTHGGMLDSVYIALKKAHRRERLMLTIHNSSTGGGRSQAEATPPALTRARIPMAELNKEKGFHMIMITEAIDPGHFWAHYLTPKTQANLRTLMESISHVKTRPLKESVPVHKLPGHYCLALYSVDGSYYRGYIDTVTDELAQVIFIDYGNEECVPLNFILQLPPELHTIPRQAFECHMMGIKPAFGGKQSEGYWKTNAKLAFRELVLHKRLFINVYSEVDGVLRVQLWDTSDPGGNDVYINDLLVAQGWAINKEEPLASKLAHDTLERLHLLQIDPSKRPNNNVHSTSIPWPPLIDGSPPPRGRTTTWKLKGPSNPYEVSFYSMTRKAGISSTRIEKDSVNSIVLNDEPQDKHHRMMVAAHVALNSMGNTILTRNTTLLPNIHGLSHLVCLLFCPTVELRVDPLNRQYIGAICGLGFNAENGVSLYPEHDMDITFDTIFRQHDIEMVNLIRSQINVALDSEANSINYGQDVIKTMQEKTRQTLIDLVLGPRESMDPITFTGSSWNLIPPDNLLLPSGPQYDHQTDNIPLYTLHCGVNVTGERATSNSVTQKIIMLQRTRDLRNQVLRLCRPTSLMCPLCKITTVSGIELRKHFNEPDHCMQEKQMEEELKEIQADTQPSIPTPQKWREELNRH